MPRIDHHPSDFVQKVCDGQQPSGVDQLLVASLRSGVGDRILELMRSNSVNKLSQVEQGIFYSVDLAHGDAVMHSLLSENDRCIQFFGSARCLPSHPEYGRIAELIGELARERLLTVLSQGGNGGLMEAASEAAMTAGAKVVGHVPHDCPEVDVRGFDESGWGIHAHHDHLVRYFTYDGRLASMSTAHPDAYIVSTALGGGTMEELARVYRQMQYGERQGLILFGEEGAGNAVRDTYGSMLTHGAISARHKVHGDPSETGLIFHAGSSIEKVKEYLRTAPWRKK